jgi:hypothetical protein
MATIKNVKETAASATNVKGNSNSLFAKDNYMWMLIGLGVMALGFILMSGGKSADPKVFDAKEVYSHTRITIAPLLIIAGLAIEIFAIMKKPKSTV